jgi:Holliday junction DNA helicase RuvA
MIGHLSGKILSKDSNQLILDVQGIGYIVFVSERTAATVAPGETLELFIHMSVRENAIDLFGFPNAWEKRVFQALLDVSGIGPKTAQNILGANEPETLLAAIVRQDGGSLTKLPGVGKKTAERIGVELGEKARKLLMERPSTGLADATRGASQKRTEGSDPHVWSDAIVALEQLGYAEAEAQAALREAGPRWEQESDKSLTRLLRLALQAIGKNRSGTEAMR